MKPSKQEHPQLLLENQVCFALYSATNALIRAYRPLLDELNITYLQYMVLMVLWQETSLTVKELGQRLRLDSGTLTPLLKRLEGKGYVQRRRSQEDERVRVISITAQGKALQKRAASIPHQLSCSMDISPARGQQLKALCEELLQALDD